MFEYALEFESHAWMACYVDRVGREAEGIIHSHFEIRFLVIFYVVIAIGPWGLKGDFHTGAL
ncbi:MAG: hypothetical protein CL912_13970 [Deltaproteobacteria bacterium]|nr:hypothetical protein [Deltaproteobacteria bacterium]